MLLKNLTQKHSLVNLFWAILSIVVYLIAFIMFIYYSQTSYASLMCIFVPVAVISWLYGLGPGIATAILGLPANMFMYKLCGHNEDVTFMLHLPGITGLLLTIFTGAAIGYVRNLVLNLKKHQEEIYAVNKSLTQEIARRTLLAEHFEKLIDISVEPIAISNKDSYIIKANTALGSMLGYTPEEMIGKKPFSFMVIREGTYESVTGEMITIDRESLESQKEKLKQIYISGNVTNMLIYCINRENKVVPVLLNAVFFFDESGKRGNGIGIMHNMTEQLTSELALIKAHKFLEDMIESCGDGIVIASSKGKTQQINEALEQMTGKTKNELIGGYAFELTPYREDDAGMYQTSTGENVFLDRKYIDTNIALISNMLEEGGAAKTIRMEYYIFHKNGTLIPVEMVITLFRDDKSDITGGIAVYRDITQRKKAERELKEAHEFRNRFFTNITHEFRTPLTLAIGPLEGIVRNEYGEVSDNISAQASISLRNCRQLLKLVNDLLDFSMLESGAQSQVYEEKDLHIFIGAIIDAFSSLASKKKIRLSLAASPDISRVRIDTTKLEKVLFNLIGNAFKFTPEKGAITVATEVSGGPDSASEYEGTRNNAFSRRGEVEKGYIKISVRDTGSGIREEDVPHIFDRFTQAGERFAHEHGGSGIGLSHARELVENMRGRITVQSRFASGSNFSVYLPFVHEQEALSEQEAPDAAGELRLEPVVELSDIHEEKNASISSLSGTKPLVLIVEDNPDMRSYIADILRRDYDFIAARNGSEGLKKLKKHLPDLILCDIMMPQMDGHAFMKQVKSDVALQHIPFIFLTAKAEPDMKVEGLEQGADDYIVKPFNSLELLARIKAFLRMRDLILTTATQEKTISKLTQKLEERYCYGNIIGNSPPMRQIYHLLDTVRDSDATILITGETGSGKELVASAIHYNSRRKSGPLITVNCGAVHRELMEREFFGHIRGAFTGAVESRRGYFEEAEGGTLFLDEIAEMDKDMQVKLLRVLENGELTRVGDSVRRKINVRLIAATNRNLEDEVEDGNLRKDLYYRINVIPVHVPPLRKRKDDIPLLAEHFMNEFRTKHEQKIPDLSPDDHRLLMNYTYPGNVRELKNIIERFCLLGDSLESIIPMAADKKPDDRFYDELLVGTDPLKRACEIAERDFIKHVLQMHPSNYKKAAQLLNIGRTSLYRKIKQYEIE